MTAIKKQHALLKQLQKKVRILQKKEEQGRKKLNAALNKMSELGRVYKSKLVHKVRMIESKFVAAQAANYAKVAADIEAQLVKRIEAKGRAIKLAIARIERKHAAQLTRGLAKKRKVKSRAARRVKSKAKIKR